MPVVVVGDAAASVSLAVGVDAVGAEVLVPVLVPDAVVVVVGTTAEDEGPFIPFDMASGRIPRSLEEVEVLAGQDGKWVGDRRSLDLPDDQVALIETAAASGKPVVVVIVAGSARM